MRLRYEQVWGRVKSLTSAPSQFHLVGCAIQAAMPAAAVLMATTAMLVPATAMRPVLLLVPMRKALMTVDAVLLGLNNLMLVVGSRGHDALAIRCIVIAGLLLGRAGADAVVVRECI